MTKNKYGAKRTIVDGIAFASQLEADVYVMLNRLEQGGEIANLEMQVRVEPDKCPECGRGATESVKVDFKYLDLNRGDNVWVEAKGCEMARWKNFVKWWRKAGPGRLQVWKAGRRQPRLVEEISP